MLFLYTDIFVSSSILTNVLLFQNPNICTSLPQEIKLFHDLSSIDTEEFVQNLGPLKEELVSRMSFSQLSSKEEYDVCMSHSLKQLRIDDSLRFDKLILAADYERSTKEENEVDIENKKLENNKNSNNADNEFEMKTNIQRMRSCKSNDSEVTLPAIRPNLVIDTSCNNASAYDCDPSEGCIIGKSISREDFKSKHSYITAWAECQSETCLNRDSANSASSNNGEDMDLDSKRNSLLDAESQLLSPDIKVNSQLGHPQQTQVHCETQSTESELLSDNVYKHCLKSVRSDHIKQPTQPIHNTRNKGLMRTQKESESNLSSDLKCYDKMRSQSVTNKEDSNEIARVTQGCNEKFHGEACRISNEILFDRESHNKSDEASVRQCLKITLIHKGCGIWAVKTLNKRKQSESESDICTKSKNSTQMILEERANQHCKRVKLTVNDDSSSQNAKLTFDKNLKHEPFLRCRTLAVKTLNKRKRSESESDNCTNSTNDALAVIEERAKQGCKVPKRMKLNSAPDNFSENVKFALPEDSSSKNLKQEPIRKKKFKSLRRLATALGEMKSRILNRPMLRRVATIRPYLI